MNNRIVLTDPSTEFQDGVTPLDANNLNVLLTGVREAANQPIPNLGTAAARDVPTSGNASPTQVVLGSDTRLASVPVVFEFTPGQTNNHNFGVVNLDNLHSTYITRTFRNTGILDSGDLSITNTNPGSFAATLLTTGIVGTADRTLTVRPSSSLSPGNYNATITVRGANGGIIDFQVSITVQCAQFSNRLFEYYTDSFMAGFINWSLESLPNGSSISNIHNPILLRIVLGGQHNYEHQIIVTDEYQGRLYDYSGSGIAHIGIYRWFGDLFLTFSSFEESFIDIYIYE